MGLAALREECPSQRQAAAAESMLGQSQGLADMVQAFRLGEGAPDGRAAGSD